MARQEAKMSLQNGSSSGIQFLIDREKRLCVGEQLTISFHTTTVPYPLSASFFSPPRISSFLDIDRLTINTLGYLGCHMDH